MQPTLAVVYKQFMDGVPRPARGRWFRFRYWVLARMFVIGEWAGSKITRSKELTALEQLYMACDVAGCHPDKLRQKLELANSTVLDAMAKLAHVKAGIDGVKQ